MPDETYAGYDGVGARLKCSMLRAHPETDEPKDAQAGAQVSQTERALLLPKIPDAYVQPKAPTPMRLQQAHTPR